MKECIAFLEDAKTLQWSMFQYIADLAFIYHFKNLFNLLKWLGFVVPMKASIY